MVDCREIVDQVRQEASIESLANTKVPVELPTVVLDKDGNVMSVRTYRQSLPRTLEVFQQSGLA